MIIDAHAHLGRYMIWAPPIIRTVEQHVREMDRCGVDKEFVSSLLALHYDFQAGNQELRQAVAKYPDRFLPYCTVHPRYMEDSIAEVRKCLGDWGWKGVKLHPDCHGYALTPLAVGPILEEAARFRAPVLIHTNDRSLTAGVECFARVAEAYPDATLIQAHMAQQAWYDSILYAKKHRNVILDTTTAIVAYSMVESAVEMVGPERVVWGSDIPLYPTALQLAKVRDADVSEEAKRLILGGNVERILKEGR